VSTELDDLQAQAIATLTTAARQKRIRGRGTDAEQSEPIDFAEFACHVITATAANLGSVETLLAGRPGSWEADLVRQIVTSTAGDELWRWRTEPLRVEFDVFYVFGDLGIEDLFYDDRDAAKDEHTAERIEELYDQDQAAYTTAYKDTVRQVLRDRGIDLAVEFVKPDPNQWDPLADSIADEARTRTPLPMTGQRPDWSDGTPADALRRTGRTYTARAATSTQEEQ
jgi:hypothetical protein